MFKIVIAVQIIKHCLNWAEHSGSVGLCTCVIPGGWGFKSRRRQSLIQILGGEGKWKPWSTTCCWSRAGSLVSGILSDQSGKSGHSWWQFGSLKYCYKLVTRFRFYWFIISIKKLVKRIFFVLKKNFFFFFFFSTCGPHWTQVCSHE